MLTTILVANPTTNTYRIAVITYMTRTTDTPAYLTHLIKDYQLEQTV